MEMKRRIVNSSTNVKINQKKKKRLAPLAWADRKSQPLFTSREMCDTLSNAIEMSPLK